MSMHTELLHRPSFTVARVVLDGGEQLLALPGAMAAHSAGVEGDAGIRGGIVRSLARRTLAREPLFLATYTAPPDGGWVDLAPGLPGDVFVLDAAAPFVIARGSLLGCAASIELSTRWGGLKRLAGGEGAFLLRATGAGTLIGSAYGGIDRHALAAGETITVDSGHLLGYDEGMDIGLRKAARGLLRTAKTREGLVFDVAGPGEVLIQSRDLRRLRAELTPPDTARVSFRSSSW
jgi:uncharacterized protein (TIGR00266 family)